MSEPTPTGDVTHGGSVSPERFARVRALFEAALERPPAERRVFVAGACVGDPALLRDVEAMLAADAHTDPLLPREHSSGSSAPEEGRFPAGSTLADRYRILGLLGRGGMGEVYRAFDLRLNQTVALKFLPEATARRASLLERFRGEVRIARQISHRNVCRVYDLGDLDGMPFLSMEYVDGEDLRSLLRRIGRLPGDKAIEIARKLCAGLAAAHEKGVLHRDLKPANIMIDGQGQVRIMDFGLAAAVDAIGDGDIRSGTPAYMAPEQLEGREVTVRSDLYALGLVLYELFTGQQVYEGPERPSAPAPATSVVKDIDPRVETAIERCLDPNPARRPASALALARMLPGGDPLAEALAAGDTPSPAMVAASEEMGALPVRWAVVCLATVLVSLAVSFVWGGQTNIVNLTPMPYSPEVLAQKGQEMAVSLGYAEPPLDRAYRLVVGSEYQTWARAELSPDVYRAQLALGKPAPVGLIYEQGPQYLTTEPRFSLLDDGARVPGRISLVLDMQGHLVKWKAIPLPPAPGQQPQLAQAMDWNRPFALAGLDRSAWTSVEPERFPDVPFDERAAWTGAFPGPAAALMPLRIEMAAWHGRLVSFELMESLAVPGGSAGVSTAMRALIAIIFVLAVWMGLRNLRRERGDTQGASRLAAFVFVCWIMRSVLTDHHTPTALGAMLLTVRLAESLLMAAFAWVLYMAAEPWVRRRWPQALISWTRLLSGDLRSPVVAGHTLIGIAAGAAVALVFLGVSRATGMPRTLGFAQFLTIETQLAWWFETAVTPLTICLSLFFLLFLARVLLRRTWLAVAAVTAVLIVLSIGNPQARPLTADFVAGLVAYVPILAIGARFGVLPMTLTLIIGTISFPFTTKLSAWFAPALGMYVAIVLAATLWAFYHALGGRRVWKQDLLDG